MKAQEDKACAGIFERGATYSNGKLVDAALMKKMTNESIHKYKRTNSRKQLRLQPKLVVPLQTKSAVPHLVVTSQVTTPLSLKQKV